jgi:hypothetical protein
MLIVSGCRSGRAIILGKIRIVFVNAKTGKYSYMDVRKGNIGKSLFCG